MHVRIGFMARQLLDLVLERIKAMRMKVLTKKAPYRIDPQCAADVEQQKRIARDEPLPDDVTEHRTLVVDVVHHTYSMARTSAMASGGFMGSTTDSRCRCLGRQSNDVTLFAAIRRVERHELRL